MKHEKTALFVVLFALVGMVFSGCAPSLQARKVDKAYLGKAMLVDPPSSRKGRRARRCIGTKIPKSTGRSTPGSSSIR